MAKYISGRQKNFKVGISSYSENLTSLEVIGKVGIGTTNATSNLYVVGNGYFTGVVTAGYFVGDGSGLTNLPGAGYVNNAGVATYAINAGVATNLVGGSNGSIPYQYSSGITSFISIGSPGLVLQSNGPGNIPTWEVGAPSNAIPGITIRDEGFIVGYSNSITQLNFVGANIIAVAATSGNISTITIADYVSNAGMATYATTAGVATALQNSRTISLTGDVSGSISFDGSTNVSIAATIQPNSVGLGTDTTGDYVTNISGTSNQITVTSGTGEGSTPTLSIPTQFTAPQDVTVTRDLQVNRNLNVNGNITLGGTTAFINVQELKVSDPDIILGVRTDAFGNDISNDTTSNHGGIAVASTEGNPLVSLYNPGIGESTLATYKKIMWFKSGSFAGLNTDAWLINYAVGIGSTQFPTGTRLAAGNVQFTENDLTVVRNINASGIVTASSFIGNALSATYATSSGIATNAGYATTSGISTVSQGLTGTPNITVGIVTASSYNGSGVNLTGIVTSIVAGTGITISGSTGQVTVNATGGGAFTLTLDQTLGYGNTSSLGMSVGLVTATNLNVTGIATIATGVVTTLRGTNINYSGISTFTSTFLSSLNVSGIATVATGVVTTLRGTNINYTGISTLSGQVLIGGGTSTGISSQPLQVTGGVYASGSVGFGTTNPRDKLDVIGNISIQGIGTANRFYLQHNTAQNSLDFVFV
jgi:hypothetical protein